MTATLVVTGEILAELRDAADHPLETAGVVLASLTRGPGQLPRLLARRVIWVNEAAYLVRERDRLSIASDGYVPALAEAERLGAMAVWLHTHPGERGVPLSSPLDDRVDEEIADLFRLRTGSAHYGALIISPRRREIAFSGYIADDRGVRTPIHRLWSVGERFRLTRSVDSELPEVSAAFDRNVRAFGKPIQRAIADLSVCIVGCGGTGSAVAEQIVRLGARRLTLIDPDHMSASNVTRVYGSTPLDITRPKTAVVSDHLRRVAPDVSIQELRSMLTVQETARHLLDHDVVFGCTDDNAGRLILSRAASYLLLPVIDCGVVLSSGPEGRLEGIDGRVTVLSPGQACLVCRDRIDLRRASAELLTPEERRRLADEGYAPALGGEEPSVVVFTTAVAAAAVMELLERMIGFGPDPRPSEILLRLHERELSTNQAPPRDHHYCHPSTGKLGIGPSDPFLGQLWSA